MYELTFEEKVRALKEQTQALSNAQILQEAVELYGKVIQATNGAGWMLVMVGGYSSTRLKLDDRIEKRGGFPGEEGNVVLRFDRGGEP